MRQTMAGTYSRGETGIVIPTEKSRELFKDVLWFLYFFINPVSG